MRGCSSPQRNLPLSSYPILSPYHHRSASPTRSMPKADLQPILLGNLPSENCEGVLVLRNTTYGFDGCKAYEQIHSTFGCGASGAQPGYCAAKWCYIDYEKCPIDKAKCEAAGGVVGSYTSPYCRERAMKSSSVITNYTPNFYSYSTCGMLDTYSESSIMDAVAGERHATSSTRLESERSFTSCDCVDDKRGARDSGDPHGRTVRLSAHSVGV